MDAMRRHPLFWGLLVLALVVGLLATTDRYQRTGRIFAGFWVMENLLVAVGGGERGPLEPLDLIRAVDGHTIAAGPEIQKTIESQDPGATFRYLVSRRGALVEVDLPTRLYTRGDFLRFIGEGLVPGLLVLAVGALAFLFKPGLPQSWLVLVFSLVSFTMTVTFADAHTTYRFSELFLAAWAFQPATLLHLALVFPQRRRIARRRPGIVWLPYVASAALAAVLVARLGAGAPLRFGLIVGVGAAYWGTSIVALVASLVRTSVAGTSPVARQRARALAAAFAIGYLPGILGTAAEAILRAPVPHMSLLWKLHVLFPAVLAYAMVRYDLFDARSALRTGAVYSIVSGLVGLAYAGGIVGIDLVLASAGVGRSPMTVAALTAVAVVALLNPVYGWTRRLVDRLFFRQRVDVERSTQQVAEMMAGLLDLPRIVELLRRTVEEQLHPARQALLILDDVRGAYVLPAAPGEEEENGATRPGPMVPADSPLVACLARLRQPLARERIEEDPALQAERPGCLAVLDSLGVELAVPVVFQQRLTGLLLLGPKRSGTAYSTPDLQLLRVLVPGTALALEHARAYAALATANAELTAALRRVEILENIRTNLAKFVPYTVRALIERAPEAPALDKRDEDVSVLFVDIVGYTRLTERLDPPQVNQLVERYFGAFLDEVLRGGGDVNETAGDGLMAIFRAPEPERHARAAVRAALGILRRTRQLNERRAAGEETIQVHVGVNSGVAPVGATKIEGRAGARWTYTASGQVTNVAARLAGLGGGDEIMVGPETRARLGSEFAVEALGERTLRNVEVPVAVFRLTLPVAAPAAA
jgi:class 3 adenylate cyclase